MTTSIVADPVTREAGWGRIINISSGGAWQPFAAMADYTATKAAVLNLTVSLSREFADTSVTVNSVSPGIIVTGSTERFSAMWRESKAGQRSGRKSKST